MRRSALLLALAVPLALVGCFDPTTGHPPAKDAAVPAFASAVTTVDAAALGSSWRAGCPVGPAQLRRVRVAYWGYDGAVHHGDLIVHQDVADDVAGAFGQLYAARFQIRRIHPVQVYGSSDDASMAANNTSAFNCRKVTGGSGWSEHAYGMAIDINPVQNPYVTRSGTILPPAAKPWADRTLRVPGMIHAKGAVRAAFAAIGWSWGGAWTDPKDYQHVSLTGR
ncbi:M15 family metallopeptidase [Aquihabitans sp. McL0605]|uniref:M15 family metallopeptidase n=1 Tax=Aquihabitans sp. McL0605 TaxID=3415671 RepID=UPI003CEE4813